MVCKYCSVFPQYRKKLSYSTLMIDPEIASGEAEPIWDLALCGRYGIRPPSPVQV